MEKLNFRQATPPPPRQDLKMAIETGFSAVIGYT